MYWWQMILFPFGVLYDGLTRLRNLLYDRQVYSSTSFDANVVAVGNLAIGGTGKTPMVDFLIDYFLKKQRKVCTLSRGYGRTSYGFRRAGLSDNPDDLGDEPYMYFEKYRGEVAVFVGEDRDLAIVELLGEEPDMEVILLDDAFQHRKVTPSANLLMTTYDQPFYSDFLLPAGRLREARMGAARADIIVVSKCPADLSPDEQKEIRTRIGRYSEAGVFFMTIIYQAPVPFPGVTSAGQSEVVAVSGLADAKSFDRYVQEHFQVKLSCHYRDHHRYTAEDVRNIVCKLDENTTLLTTEKDMVKLKQFKELQSYSCYYLPIHMKFLSDESLFLDQLESWLKKSANEGK